MLTVGHSIGSCNGVNVVIDTELKKAYTAQPGCQKWVMVIECISASGISISLYIIFVRTGNFEKVLSLLLLEDSISRKFRCKRIWKVYIKAM